jgi:hypothetical protein
VSIIRYTKCMVFRVSFCVVLPYELENLLFTILRHVKLEYDVKMNITWWEKLIF